MTVKTLVEAMHLEVATGDIGLDNEIEGGCVGDLLSYVMAHGEEKNMWVTIQGHINTLAVASLLGMSVIVLAGNTQPTEEMVHKAKEESIPIVMTPLSSFAFCTACSKWL